MVDEFKVYLILFLFADSFSVVTNLLTTFVNHIELNIGILNIIYIHMSAEG